MRIRRSETYTKMHREAVKLRDISGYLGADGRITANEKGLTEMWTKSKRTILF